MARRFKHPLNNHVETASGPFSWLWCLLFGPIYFAVKGNWPHVFVSAILGLITFSLSWWIYPFFVYGINARKYQRDGWIELERSTDPSASAAESFDQPSEADIDEMIARQKARLATDRDKTTRGASARGSETPSSQQSGFGKRMPSLSS